MDTLGPGQLCGNNMSKYPWKNTPVPGFQNSAPTSLFLLYQTRVRLETDSN